MKLHRHAPDAVPGGETDPHPRPSGFKGTFEGMSLWDVVQMACLAGTQRAVRVHTAEREGHLFFNGGIVVHAVVGGTIGDAAVLEMLQWETGELTPCRIEWPTAQTVHTPWETLLLQAALRKDEADEAAATDLDPDAPDLMSELVLADPTAEWNGTLGGDHVPRWQSAPNPHSPAQRSVAPPRPLPSAAAKVELDADGALINRHGDAEGLGERFAHARVMADQLSELLALGGFEAMEVTSGGTSIFSCRNPHGGTTVHRSDEDTSRAALRAELEL